MHIATLHSENFRNLASQTLAFHPHVNLICGDNGAGKTALLEALYTLGRGKSFRENQTRHIIRHDEAQFRLIATLAQNGQMRRLGMEKSAREHRLRVDGEDLKNLSHLARLLPVEIINADNFALIDQGPEHRRRFADYGLFYAEPRFLPAWQRYQYALKNRNAALRADWPDAQIRPWHKLMAEHADAIDQYRRAYLADLERTLNHFHAELGGLDTIRIHYQRGWAQDSHLADLLDRHLARDRHLKHTRDGIHRSDLRFYAGERDIAHHYSRGQQKTLMAALILAQSQHIALHFGHHPVMLVDDISAELDPERRHMLLGFLIASGAQIFITQIRDNNPLAIPCAHQRYHIAHGHITADSA
ncbi:MAG: DNA replication/repair protein RecF [Cardiobacteriaceae bacterium]|nr:DNA replication/repair protein RecF [Cardiobacteriaceae bacterium]